MSVSAYGLVSGGTTESPHAHNILQLQALPATGIYLIERFPMYHRSNRSFITGSKEFTA